MTRKFYLHFTLLSVISILILTGCGGFNELPLLDDGQPVTFETPATTDVAAPRQAPPPIVNYKHVTLNNLNLNNQGNEIMIKPGKSIQATLNYAYNCSNCSQNSNNQIIIGLANRSAQACIYNGGPQGQGSANFELKVPAKPGRYDVRFRALQAADCNEALKAGWGADDSPSRETTIGKITVSRKAEA